MTLPSPVTQAEYEAAMVRVECGVTGVEEAEIIRSWIAFITAQLAMYCTACLEDVNSDDE